MLIPPYCLYNIPKYGIVMRYYDWTCDFCYWNNAIAIEINKCSETIAIVSKIMDVWHMKITNWYFVLAVLWANVKYISCPSFSALNEWHNNCEYYMLNVCRIFLHWLLWLCLYIYIYIYRIIIDDLKSPYTWGFKFSSLLFPLEFCTIICPRTEARKSYLAANCFEIELFYCAFLAIGSVLHPQRAPIA